MDVEVVVSAEAECAEGPSWDERRGRLLWVDISAGNVHELDVATGTDSVFSLGRQVGAAIPRKSGGLVLCHQGGISGFDPETGVLETLAELPGNDPGVEMNDAKCDPAGRLFAGTMHALDLPGASALYCLDPTLNLVPVITGVTVSNGIAWSPDGTTMYFVDSPTRRIDAFNYDLATGAISDRRVLVTFCGEPVPDGLCVDSHGHLWVALWGGGRVERYSPGGELDLVVDIPVSHVTSCCFGGEHLDELFITTASPPGTSSRTPMAGSVIRVRPGVQGLPTNRFGG